MMIPAYPDWLSSDALDIAPRLLGCEIICTTTQGTAGGRIVELEVYHGAEDPASHAFRGKTARNAPMFKVGGHIYVYLSYGLHRCVNIVTGPAEQAQAILIRAIEPTLGLELMQERRGPVAKQNLANGPGKLAQAMGINLEMSGEVIGGQIRLIEHVRLPLNKISTGSRIGITTATDKPWRYWITGSPFVSR